MKRVSWVLLLLGGCTVGDPHAVWRNPKDGMVFVRVPPGILRLNPSRTDTQPAKSSAEVAFPEGFWMGRTEVTVEQFRRFARETGYASDAEKAKARYTWKSPGFQQTDEHPAVFLSFVDAEAYTRWAGVDLPTEAQWLYACRANTSTRFYWGDEVNKAAFWHRENSPYSSHPVARKPPNPWGLYDLLGNAYEWCRVEPSTDSSDQTVAYPFGGSWTRCPDRFEWDIPRVPSPHYPIMPWDDDRGFRCVRR